MTSILLVEDEHAASYTKMLDGLQKYLPDVTVTEAQSLGYAEAAAKTMHFDAAILDLGLPDSATDFTVERIFRLSRQWRFPIVAITGHSYEGLREECIRNGAKYFFAKTKAEEYPGVFCEVIYTTILNYRRDFSDHGSHAPI